jgi:hypothetical protein
VFLIHLMSVAAGSVSFRMQMLKDKTHSTPGAAVISLSKWMQAVGITACTVWRWRKKGWLQTINIAGRQYLTQEAIDRFQRRAVSGEFAQVHKVPRSKVA